MLVVVRRERRRGERRVAVVPDGVRRLLERGDVEVLVERDAGAAAGFDDRAYTRAGARVSEPGSDGLHGDVVVTIAPPSGTATRSGPVAGSWHVALFDPLWLPGNVAGLARRGVTTFSLDLVPRTTRAQSMDVLSSMATIAGYRAALLGASRLPRLFPLMMTAAGTLRPAKVLVLGAGVAGLQAIATARRLGAVVHGYDVRPAAMEQIRSLGAKAVVDPRAAGEADAQDGGGYARAVGDDEAEYQRALLAPHVASSDVVITTAAIPGRASPLLITADMVAAMEPGTVVIDLAAERGGNVEPSRADGEVVHEGVLVLGPTDLTSDAADHASTMFSTNVVNLLEHLFDQADGLEPDRTDEITDAMLVAVNGSVVHDGVRSALGLDGRTQPAAGGG